MKTIFVDFFDTIMFRYIHPFAVYEQWAKKIIEKFKIAISIEQLIKERNIAFQSTRKIYGEVDYRESMKLLYNSLNTSSPNFTTENQFIEFCLRLETALEIGVQYPNYKLIKILRDAKSGGTKYISFQIFIWGK